MGSTFTKDVVNEAVSASVGIVNSSVNDCATPVTATNSVNINASGGSTVYYGGNYDSSITINAACMSSNVSRNSTTFQLTEQTKQTVDSISQQFELSRSSTKAVYKTMTNIATQITDQFNQNCVTSLNTENSVNIDASDGSTVYAVTNSSQVANVISSCLLKSDTVSSSSDQLEIQLEAAVTSKVQNFLFYLIMLVLIIGIIITIIVVVLIMMGVIGKKKKTTTTTKKAPVKKKTT